MVKKDLLYSKEHEWVRVEGTKAYIGISDHAQEALGSIVFVELPEVGVKLAKDEVLGVVESVKAASDVYSPLTGTVTEVNRVLINEPEKLNEEPYEFWMAAMELSDINELKELMDSDAYEIFLGEGA